MNDLEYCQQVCRKSQSNFTYTFSLLPRKKRNAMEAFYCFCRLVDDAVDDAEHIESAQLELKCWHDEIERCYNSNAKHPAFKILWPTIQEKKIPKNLFHEIVNGCETDLNDVNFASKEDLQKYCYQVAGCVGLICLYICSPVVLRSYKSSAEQLGYAVQWTNIIRDIPEDLARERFYLPQNDLKKFSLCINDFKDPFINSKKPQIEDFLKHQISIAQEFYKYAWESFPKAKEIKRSLISSHLMGKTYEKLLKEISRNPMKIFENKPKLKTYQKIKLIINSLTLNYF